LKDISRLLGQEHSDEELQTALSELDANKDGKISLEEFTLWWKSGRKGANKTMRKLTRGVASVKNLLSHAQAEIEKLTEVDEEPSFSEVNLFIGN
jgi:Ca2+-binding EF-hand superfamily protein